MVIRDVFTLPLEVARMPVDMLNTMRREARRKLLIYVQNLERLYYEYVAGEDVEL